MESTTPTFSVKAVGLRWLVPATLSAVVALVVLTVLAAVVGNGPAVAGALIGGVAVLVTSLFAVLSLTMVVWVHSRLALLVAMMTYLLQVMLLALLFVSYQKHEELQDEIARSWLGAGIATAAVAWTVGYLVAAYRDRNDVPSSWDGPAEQAGAR